MRTERVILEQNGAGRAGRPGRLLCAPGLRRIAVIMATRCYSRRLLQPFRGTCQVVAVPHAEAESTDGFHWILYVMDERIVTHTGLPEVRYGTWSPATGLVRSRVRGTARDSLIEEAGDLLVGALESCADRVPFPPADVFECWLLAEEDQRPLVLLETAVAGGQPGIPDRPRWYPGSAELSDFRSAHGGGRELAALIERSAGNRPRAIWLRRLADGSGTGEPGVRVAAGDFPRLMLRDRWPSSGERGLIEDFLAWQAPWLLQLAGLDDSCRQWLEEAAWQRPVITARVWRLYPALLDRDGLGVARVKARIMEGDADRVEPPEPFYPIVNE